MLGAGGDVAHRVAGHRRLARPDPLGYGRHPRARGGREDMAAVALRSRHVVTYPTSSDSSPWALAAVRLTRDEVRAVLRRVEGTPRLMAFPIWRAGRAVWNCRRRWPGNIRTRRGSEDGKCPKRFYCRTSTEESHPCYTSPARSGWVTIPVSPSTNRLVVRRTGEVSSMSRPPDASIAPEQRM